MNDDLYLQQINLRAERKAANVAGWALGLLVWLFLVLGILRQDKKWFFAAFVTEVQAQIIGRYETILDGSIVKQEGGHDG